MKDWQHYERYDTEVNIHTGEIKLPISNCGADEKDVKCHHIMSWEKAGCPTHLDKLELAIFKQEVLEDWVFYIKYDTTVNIKTGEINMPNCSCKPEDECYYLKIWEEEGCPTNLDKEELEIVRKEYYEGVRKQ